MTGRAPSGQALGASPPKPANGLAPSGDDPSREQPLPMPPKMIRALARIAKKHAPEKVAARRNRAIRRSKPKGWLAECAETQGWKCAYCQRSMRRKPRADKPWLTATLDHVLPISRGGRNQRSNLVAACLGCNQAKGAMTAEEYQEARDTDGRPKGPDRNGLDGEAATAGAEGIAQGSTP